MRSFIVVAALSAIASAQNYSVGANGQLMIDASQISSGERQSWCLGQRNNCPKVCEGPANPNSCDSNTLEWTCTCTNGNTPNITDYTEMVPFYICQQWIANCVASNPNDATAQFGCRSVVCGSQNASALAVDSSSSSSSSSSPSSSATGTPTTNGGGSSGTRPTESAAASSSGAAVALNVAQSYGSGILAAGLLASFGLAL
ncbi:hypothetical protein TI39_contig4175g00002 [Zymoseptoria brevis]|uniref:DUF7707 domain-containing protein n=1 Tax=Zymoseptoria brevis TaxID=1047168 RepID=A0A0F4GB47_9PEZI|nr:hypothetical protein TI39_contig4175g00002 [Zymoseptoria brevis]